MSRTLRVAQFGNVVLVALVMGVFWGTWFSLSRSIASITPESFLEIGHLMIANLGGPMSVLMRQGRGAATYLTLAGLLLLAAALVVTLAVNVPIDDEINQWTRNTLPPNWTVMRDRWEFYHTVRTFASIGSLGCAVAGALRVALPRGQRP
jgi:uncharacterized membrane protein